METTARITLPLVPRIRLVLMGDAHVGNAGCREDLLRATIGAVMADEYSYLIDVGDTVDAINMADKRFDPSQLAEWMTIGDLVDIARAEVDRYLEIVGPAKGRILALCRGNHEDTLSRIAERDVYREIAEGLGLPPGRRLGYGGFLQLRIADRRGRKAGGSRQAWIVTIFCHHGHDGGRLWGSKALSLERLMGRFWADIYVLGHSHTKFGGRMSVVTPEGQKDVALINVGAFLQPYQQGKKGGYAERKLLYPQGLGPVEVWLYPEERQMRIVQ